MTDEMHGQAAAGRMRKRRSVLEDGRYLIYYTFDGEGENPAAGEGTTARPEPVAENVAEEERIV